MIELTQLHLGLRKAEAQKRAVEMLTRVGIPDAGKVAEGYQHQLSGGMRQRVMIAMALSTGPKLLIADEPTTACDVTIQALILDLIRRLRDETGTAVILTTHNLGVLSGIADRVVVLYAGRVFESARTVNYWGIRRTLTRARCSGPFPMTTSGTTAGGKSCSKLPACRPCWLSCHRPDARLQNVVRRFCRDAARGSRLFRKLRRAIRRSAGGTVKCQSKRYCPFAI